MKALAILATALPLAAAAQSIAFQRSGDIAWACGGVGSDERSVLGVFDEFRDKVLEMALKQYVPGPQNRYSIS